MNEKSRHIESSCEGESEHTEHGIDKRLEREFLPLVARYRDGKIEIEIRYLDGKKPCKGLSADEVKNVTGQMMRIYEAKIGLIG